MSGLDQSKDDEIIIEAISDLTDAQQAEVIADNFEKISLDYEPLTDTSIAPILYETPRVQTIEPYQVYDTIKSMKTKSSTVQGDISNETNQGIWRGIGISTS